VQAWLSLHESAATQRAYRKEAERLILWAIVERGRALSSLTTEDAVGYRAFLRGPTPRERWVGPVRSRRAPDWRPFSGGLSARPAAYALSVLGALFRWLIEHRYLLANPFAGVKVRGSGPTNALDTSHVFTEGEWMLVRAIADGLECRTGGPPRRHSDCVLFWISGMRRACAQANWSARRSVISRPTRRRPLDQGRRERAQGSQGRVAATRPCSARSVSSSGQVSWGPCVPNWSG
jgi:hypothetical protein